ncbi:hypothetical protein RNO80_18385, partial [Escherichia coli]|nr:hypothetical protein [Escherichia coli]
MSKKKIPFENEEFITYRALLLSIDFVKKLVIEMSDEDLNKGNDSNLLIVFYVQIMPDDFVMQLHR